MLGPCCDPATLQLHSRHYKGGVRMHGRVGEGERRQLVVGKEVKMRGKCQKCGLFLLCS